MRVHPLLAVGLLLVVSLTPASCTSGWLLGGAWQTTDAGAPGGGLDGGGPPVGGDPAPTGLLARPVNATCTAPARPASTSGVALQRAFANLTFSSPLLLLQAPNDATSVFVVQRGGAVVRFPNRSDAAQSEVTRFVTVSRIDSRGEGGLLGMAFHPRWPAQAEAFLSYTEAGAGTPLRSVIARYRSSDGGSTLDGASEERLFVIDQPYDNHKGGNIAFGQDGFLYIGLGDGGSGGDPLNTAQRTNSNLGKFLRIDVDVPFAQRYAIPADNPFASTGQPCNRDSTAYERTELARCAEIYALGFRNPWRWSFDRQTGELWAGDVGQNTYEEVDRVVRGGNYGWRIREGAHCYNPSNCAGMTAGLIDPVVEYGRGEGVSITGGYVYRGSNLPDLVGRFIFGDYSSGRIWAVTPDPTTGGFARQLLVDSTLALASFGQTHDGEVYALGLSDGRIEKLVPQAAPPGTAFPDRLSATGCFDPTDPRRPALGLIPYDVNAELWSDGATKERFFAVPDGARITVAADGDFELPNGTVTAKTFFLSGRRVETRLFMRHPDGVWAGYSYEWADDESDALLLPAGKTKTVGAQPWTFPSRAQCLTCHTAIAGRTLGLEVAQLNRPFGYPTGQTANQLATYSYIGLFSSPLGEAPASLPQLARPFGSAALELRARAYLHANCSGCHRQNAGQGPQDLRYQLPLDQVGACDVPPQNGSLGIADARILAPGAPQRSVLSVRMHAQDGNRMPPLASAAVDPAGIALVDAWIASLSGCTP